jgi:hypothetical protein
MIDHVLEPLHTYGFYHLQNMLRYRGYYENKWRLWYQLRIEEWVSEW